MKRLTIYTFLGLIVTGLLHGSFGDAFHEKLMKIGWSRCLSELNLYPVDQQRTILEKALRAFGSDIPPREAERQKNYEIAQSAMLSIPGYAQYYQDKIENTREQVKKDHSLSPEEKERLRRGGKPALGLGDYESVRSGAFQVLAQLPSPETVAVLGHFLEDPEGRNGKDMLGGPLFTGSDTMPRLPNCGLACDAISNLGIEYPPIRGISKEADVVLNPERVDAWKDWWREVKAGKRTYRFKGSSIEYGPDGPASKRAVERLSKDRHGAGKRNNGSDQIGSLAGGPTSSKAPLIAWFLAGITVLFSAVWYFRKAAK